jgi:hypothetical protein
LTTADSALVDVRRQVLASAARSQVDSLDPKLMARHDSLVNELADLESLIGKVRTIPLASSYRSLAGSPALTGSGRVQMLLDSLDIIERERDAFDTVGGADPMFVALTTRATEIGHGIEELATQRREDLRTQISRIVTPSEQVAAAQAATPDTMPWIAERDSARAAMVGAAADLANARQRLDANRRQAEQAQEISAISASPLAIIVAAAVFGIFFGFAGALRSEFRHPTVADGPELERITGARVMATVVPARPNQEPDRRKSDRLAPGYLDPAAESYQLAYLYLEQSAASPDIVAIVGDDPDVSAIVAMNLAAIAAEDARSVAVIDSAGRSDAICALIPVSRSEDIAAVLGGRGSWVDSTSRVSVGRDRTVDVVTGTSSIDPAELIALLHRDREHLGRLYDLVLVLGTPALVSSMGDTDLVDGTVLTMTGARTPLKLVVDSTMALRANGQKIFGLVLWDAPPPRLAARPRRTPGGRRGHPKAAVSPAGAEVV